MTLSKITRQSVLSAIAEYDKKGGENFLAEYGFQDARQYFLVYDDKEYPSKAILGVAHKYVDIERKPLAAKDFSGGKNTVEKKLTDLGFIVRSPSLSP